MTDKYEAPKRYTALNDVTGDLIKSRTDGQDKYSEGWDRIFGKKKDEVVETNNGFLFTPCENCPPDAYCKSPFCKNLIKFNDAYPREDED